MQFNIDNVDNIDNIVYYKFLGGEPLLNKSHDKLLQKIKNIEKVTLEYTTNGSIYPNTYAMVKVVVMILDTIIWHIVMNTEK